MNPASTGWNIDLNRLQWGAAVVGVIALALSGVGWLSSPDQFFFSYLVGYLLWMGIALGCMSLLMIHHMTGGNWGWATRHLFESGSRTMPLMLILVIPILIGIPKLYTWAQADEVAKSHLIAHKAQYLNTNAFLIRTVVYFLVWLLFMYLLNRRSPELPVRNRRVSGPGLVVHAFVVTFAIFDWVMSLEPEWYSTIFGLIFMVGQLLTAMSFAILVLAFRADQRPFKEVLMPSRFHDLGNLMLAFVMLWAYTSFSQFLIIWAGNLPEEIPFYTHRLDNGWQWIALLLVLFHFGLPFVLLLMRFVKRRAQLLAAVSVGMIVIRLIDLFWIVQPAHLKNLQLHWLDPVLPIGIGGLWIAAFIWQLKRQPAVPATAPAVVA